MVHAKNKSITDKNMGAADADKADVILECVRQLGYTKTYLKFQKKKLNNSLQKYKRN